DGVAAGVEVEELEHAIGGGDGFLGGAGAFGGEVEVGAGNDGIRGVVDEAGDGAGDADLSAGGERGAEGCREEQQDRARADVVHGVPPLPETAGCKRFLFVIVYTARRRGS